MPMIVRAFPLIERNGEGVREIAREIAGPRREEAAAFFRSYGVVQESWHLQKTPAGTIVIAVTEMGEPDVKAAEYAASVRPFDRWFKEAVQRLTGIDPSVEPLGPPTVQVLEWRAEEAVSPKLCE